MAFHFWSMKDVSQICKDWMGNEFDGLIVFDGNRGLGKSTGAIKLAYTIKGFKPKKDIVFSRDDVIHSLATKKHSVIVADEMINVTYNRDFYSETQKQLIKMLNMYRDSCNILISCVPNFYDLDKQFRALVKMRVNVVRRGLAIIHTPNQCSYKADQWDMKINEKIEEGWMKKQTFKPNYSKLSTYRGMLKYGKLKVRQQKLYDDIKQEKRNILYQKEKEQKEEGKTAFYDKILERVKSGDLTKEMLLQFCLIRGTKYSGMVTALNNRLRDSGDKHTLSNYLQGGIGIKSSVPSSNVLEQNKNKIPVPV